jgi:microcystin-dependent protein
MPKNKVSEYSPTASNNTDIGGINIAEGCAPSGINNAIRELMAQLKDMQAGTDGDNFSIGGNLAVTGTTTLTGTTAAPTPSTSDDSTKIATTAFVRDIIPTGVIVMWSGTIATIPSGWLLCDGSNSTPDLRSRFIIGANADDGGAAKTNVTGSATQTGGSKDAIVVSHTHSVTDPGHSHTFPSRTGLTGNVFGFQSPYNGLGDNQNSPVTTATTGISIASTGSSGTNANLVPYYALAFIMKS